MRTTTKGEHHGRKSRRSWTALLSRRNINAPPSTRPRDPQKMIDQLIRDYTNSITRPRTHPGQPCMAEKDHEEDARAADQPEVAAAKPRG